MSNILGEMIESKNDKNVAWLTYKQERKRVSDSFFCFFEGEDRKFYLKRIESQIGKICSYNCGGRKAVLDISNKLKNEDSCLFFIDADFNLYTEEIDKDNRIFQTKKYSIENYFLDINSFNYLLRCVIGLNEANHYFKTISQGFENARNNFLNLNVDITAYSIACVVNDLEPISKSFQYNEYFKIEIDKVVNIDSLTKDMINEKIEKNIIKKFGVDDRNKKEEVITTYNNCYKYVEKNIEVFIRGKNYLWFIKKYLQSLKSYFKSNQTLNQYSKTFPTISDDYILLFASDSNIMQSPPELKAFLNNADCKIKLDN